MIPTYESGGLLEPTLRSVLAQDPGPDQMQIEVVDDCSSADPPEPVVDRLARDRVDVYRQPVNVGISANFTTCIRRSVGEWVHILHGDDLVRETFYEHARSVIDANEDVGAVIFGCDVIDHAGAIVESSEPLRAEAGILDEALVRALFSYNAIRTPAVIVRRSVYEEIGGFAPTLSYTADWDMWKRILATAPTWFEPEVLALYRTHEAADSANASASGRSAREDLVSIKLARNYLDAERSADYTRAAYAEKRREAWRLARANGDRDGLAKRSVYIRHVVRCLAGEATERARGLGRRANLGVTTRLRSVDAAEP
ncbi:MAG TPA: glycosyltransferase [Thermoleophilaceae bacterium]|jgi:glycosyltransferase involved in cell wall biosynthesis